MSNIGISYWGFCESFDQCKTANTPDGHRYGRPLLVQELLDRNHVVYSMQKKREQIAYPGLIYAENRFPDLDLLFIEWRWATYKNYGPAKFESDYDRQLELLNYYHGKIPIVVWDADLKITPDDEKQWPEMLVVEPTFKPCEFTLPRRPLMFWTDFKQLVKPDYVLPEYGYIGNNYEREYQFSKYYSNVAKGLRHHGIQSKVWGNWLQRSPERLSPEELIKNNKFVSFCDRTSFYESMIKLSKFICTTHITKDRYSYQGFVTARYFENIVVGTPGMVPEEFLVNDILGKKWCVSSELDVISNVVKLSKLTFEQRNEVIQEQKMALMSKYDFSVEFAASFLEDAAKTGREAFLNL
jgi:hypothetical protein